MSTTINLSSENLQFDQASENFTVNFKNPLNFNDANYEVAMYNASVIFAWPSISSNLKNDTLRYVNGAGTLRVETIPAGQYTVQSINDQLHAFMIANGDEIAPGVFGISIFANFSTGRIEIVVTDGTLFEFDMTVGDLNLLLGFGKVVLAAQAGPHVGTELANINNNVLSLLVSTDIVSGSFLNENSAGVLATIPINAGPHEEIQFNPSNLIWLPMELKKIQRITMTLSDQSGRSFPIIDMQGEEVSYSIIIRKRRDQTLTLNK